MNRRNALVLAAAIVLFALGVRIAHAAGRDSIWRDEGQDMAIVNAAMQSGSLLETLESEGAPPLHYLVEAAFVRMFGPSLMARRAESILFGTLAVLLVLVASWRAFGRASGLLAGLLMATSPFFIFYSAEIRSYGLLSAVAALMAVVYLEFLDRPSIGRAALWGAVSALCAYTHYFAFQLILIGGCYALFRERSRRGVLHALVSGVVFLVLFAPWLPTFFSQLSPTFDGATRSWC